MKDLCHRQGKPPSIRIPGAPATTPPPNFPKMDCNKAVFVTEFYIDPKRIKDRMGEFIEFFNGDEKAVTLNGWRLTDLAGDSHIISPTQPFVLEPGEFAVLGINANIHSNGGIYVDYEYKRFNLSNDADRVRLEDPCGTPVFDVSYPLPRNWPKHRAGHSIELMTDPTSEKKPKWRRSRHRLKSGDYATPGFAPWKQKANRLSVAPKEALLRQASDKPNEKEQTEHLTNDSRRE